MIRDFPFSYLIADVPDRQSIFEYDNVEVDAGLFEMNLKSSYSADDRLLSKLDMVMTWSAKIECPSTIPSKSMRCMRNDHSRILQTYTQIEKKVVYGLTAELILTSGKEIDSLFKDFIAFSNHMMYILSRR